MTRPAFPAFDDESSICRQLDPQAFGLAPSRWWVLEWTLTAGRGRWVVETVVVMNRSGVAGLRPGEATADTKPFPSIFPAQPVRIGPLPVSQGYLYSVASVAVLLVLFSLFFKFSRYGIAMRATAFSQQVALSMGISVKRIFALSWSIAAVVSAVGGILLGGVRGGVDGALGFFGLKVIPVVILGGLDSVLGAIVGGVVMGVLENLSGGYLDPLLGGGVKEVAPFIALVAILAVKPYGLFGKVKIERV